MLFSNPPLVAIRSRLSLGNRAKYSHYPTNSFAWLLSGAILFVYATLHAPEEILLTFFVSLVILQIWQWVFCSPKLKHIIPSCHAILHAMLFSLLLPLTISTWLLLLCVSFGCVFGERVFGGRGYSFLHPVAVGIAFYLYSQNIDPASTGANLVPLWIVVSIGVVLLYLELVSWRTLAGLIAGLLSTFWIVDLIAVQALLSHSGILIAILFLAADPGSGGSTNTSRWVHGALFGLLLALLYSQDTQPMLATLFAILLASLSVPLIDYVVVQIHTSRRRRRHE